MVCMQTRRASSSCIDGDSCRLLLKYSYGVLQFGMDDYNGFAQAGLVDNKWKEKVYRYR
jgi:hypothetical protein